MEDVHRLLLRGGADIQDELELPGRALGSAHEVRRLHADDAMHPLTERVSDQDILTSEHVGRETAELYERHCAVGADGLDHAPDLIAVSVEHENRLVSREIVGGDKRIVDGIALDLCPSAAKVAHNVNDLILEARGGLCVRKPAEEVCDLAVIEIHG